VVVRPTKPLMRRVTRYLEKADDQIGGADNEQSVSNFRHGSMSVCVVVLVIYSFKEM
jgi:hypothetical protein